jgi:hypothetical protein
MTKVIVKKGKIKIRKSGQKRIGTNPEKPCVAGSNPTLSTEGSAEKTLLFHC